MKKTTANNMSSNQSIQKTNSISALDTLRNEFRTDEESIAHSEALSILSYDD